MGCIFMYILPVFGKNRIHYDPVQLYVCMYIHKYGTLEHCCTIAFYILSTKEDVGVTNEYILAHTLI
jgi:hypothetical protein